MKNAIVKTLAAAGLLLWIACAVGAEAAPAAPMSLPQLQTRLNEILQATHVPGVSVAIVRTDGPEWIGAVGLRNVQSGAPATAATLFRIGSTSKAFVSLSLLQLVEAGKVRLEDPVSKYLGDAWFENRWEREHPTLVVDLLEHTTGWDDMHFREYAKQAPGMRLEDGLNYDHSSRVARWRPGTRMAYCNSGLAVAALVVEKVTGQRFEDYVQANLFTPIGMTTATYFEPHGAIATTLYHEDGMTPFPYWHILLRPAGSINASAQDMAAYLAFYLHRGSVGSTPVVSAASLDRMELPTRTLAARNGLSVGYGLSNYATIADGFVYHGHDGGVTGGLTEMAYLKEAGVGFFFSINSGNGAAFQQIAELMRAYVTQHLTKPAVPAAAPLPAFVHEYEGWYRPDSPRSQNLAFMERLLGLTRARVEGQALVLKGLFSPPERFVAVEGRTLRRDDGPNNRDPVASLALVSPTDEGRFIGSGLAGTLRQIPTWQALVDLGGLAWWSTALVSTLLYGACWLAAGLFGRRRPVDAPLRRPLLLSAVSLVLAVVLVAVGSGDLLERFGVLSAWSVGLCALTLVHALGVLWSVRTAFAATSAAARVWVRRQARFAALGLLLGLVYLAFFGVIGIRTWA